MVNLQTIFNSFDKQKIESYKIYWDGIKPQTDEQYFNRWVFSFLSVHTTWSSNVRAYLLLKEDNSWRNDKQALEDLLKQSGVGLYQRRREGIWAFKESFIQTPESWKPLIGETWQECRKRLEERCNGLGYAKTAFALEMCFPTVVEVTCLDTHMLQLFGYAAGKQAQVSKGKKYIELENQWMESCTEFNIPSYIARSLYWDDKQKQNNSRYWSYVLET